MDVEKKPPTHLNLQLTKTVWVSPQMSVSFVINLPLSTRIATVTVKNVWDMNIVFS